MLPSVLAGQNPIHYQPVPACAGSGFNPFRIQLRRYPIKTYASGPQSLHTLDCPGLPSTEAVRLAVLTAAFFCPFSKACATQLSEAFTMRVCQKAIAARQQVSVEELDARLSGKVVEMPRRAETA